MRVPIAFIVMCSMYHVVPWCPPPAALSSRQVKY
ncbi:MAG: hypothetical protein OJF50_002388 [Nitrospira sp.]|nr:hypothetical protein [Nitrospira sp.]